jgi:hypothetical protein
MAEKKLINDRPNRDLGAVFMNPAADTLTDENGEVVPLEDSLEFQRSKMEEAAKKEADAAKQTNENPTVEADLTDATSQLASKHGTSTAEEKSKLVKNREADKKLAEEAGRAPADAKEVPPGPPSGDTKVKPTSEVLGVKAGEPQVKNNDPKSAPKP